LIYPRKEHSPSVSDESDLNLAPLKLSSRKTGKNNSNTKSVFKEYEISNKNIKI
jgi:hypothetical protein